MNYDELHAKLSAHGQEQLLKFWDELDDGGKAQLASQIAAIDFDRLDDRLEIVSQLPNVRKISCSPWRSPRSPSPGSCS